MRAASGEGFLLHLSGAYFTTVDTIDIYIYIYIYDTIMTIMVGKMIMLNKKKETNL